MAMGTLSLCYGNVDVFRGVVKLRRGQRLVSVLDRAVGGACTTTCDPVCTPTFMPLHAPLMRLHVHAAMQAIRVAPFSFLAHPCMTLQADLQAACLVAVRQVSLCYCVSTGRCLER